MQLTAADLPVNRVIPESIARLLEEEIIFGALSPGTRLTEEDVAAKYNVSRSPVREGLRLLERDGLVRRSARRGIWIAQLSVADLDEVYCCRVALEGLAAEAAARSPSAPATRSKFQQLLSHMREAAAARDARELFRADIEGSAAIYALANNATLRRLLASLEKQALRYRFFAYAQSQEVVQLSLDGTAQIYDRICGNDAAGAKELTAHLITEIWQAMRPMITQSFPEES